MPQRDPRRPLDGGGEVARYIGRHGTERVSAAVLLSAVVPLMLKAAKNPEGAPPSAFDELRRRTLANRAQFFRDLAEPSYGYNRKGAQRSQGVVDAFWRLGMQCGIKAAYTDDLKRFDVPTLIVHGSDDQIVPIAAAALKSSKPIPGATFKVYEGAPNGIATTDAERFNDDVLAFMRASAERGEPLRHSSARVLDLVTERPNLGDMAYPAIADHGLIGNLRTAALVATDGTIDWFCFPRFDSPSVFASLLDDKKGGSFRIAPVTSRWTSKQLYWPDTNVLLTRFFTGDGVGEISDFMPIGAPTEDLGAHVLVRRVRVTRGTVKFGADCRPAFDYARARHVLDVAPGRAVFATSALAFALITPIPLQRSDGDGVNATFVLEEGQSAVFVFGEYIRETTCPVAIARRADELFDSTVAYWRRWLRKSTYAGRWREMVHRSALVLKLLTYEPSGAIVAAPTCSLPEVIGGRRNWDYRYSWVRDAAFTVYGLMRIGFTDEAEAFMAWLRRCVRDTDKTMQIMYGIDGEHELVERELGHLDGYAGSRPVRIGNGAYHQLQLDIYGELLDAVYLWNKYGTPVPYDGWVAVRRMVDWLAANWQRPDDGIWEVRGGSQHFTYSKMMCWVAFDRALRLADKRSFPADRERWLRVRDEIYEEIMRKAWDAERRTFVQSYDSPALDASLLLMPLVFFLSPTDPRMLGTLRAIKRSPRDGGLVSDSLVFRYDLRTDVDGICPGEICGVDRFEGTFNLCTFWLVEALTRAGRTNPELLDEARLMFERMMGYANHLGLYSEEIGQNGEALGNFPQAFTHLALISAAYNLDHLLK